MQTEQFQRIKELVRHSRHWDFHSKPEAPLVEELKAILTKYPDVVNEFNNDFDDKWSDGVTILHYASCTRSAEFCKILAEANPRAVSAPDGRGWLPLHHACAGNVETAKYLFELYPEGIHIPDSRGCYPIHHLCRGFYNCDENHFELTKFLLQHDRGALSIPDGEGYLPLHHAVKRRRLIIIIMIYNAHPEAILIRGKDGRTPLDTADRSDNCKTPSFLELQLEFIRQAREDTEQDYFGHLPIHRALQNKDVPLGTIKLMLAANPNSICMVNHQGMLPIHMACLSGNLDIVKFLFEANEDSLQKYDIEGNSALHISCLAGNTDIVNYILDKSDHGVFVRNADGNLPIQLLLFHAKCDRDSMGYMDAVDSLVRIFPAFCSNSTF